MKYEVQEQQLANELIEFVATIAPLEQKVGRRLNEPGRGACLAAFSANREAFERLAADALDRGRNPLALLARMVLDGDHREEPPAAGLNRCGCNHAECRFQPACLRAAA